MKKHWLQGISVALLVAMVSISVFPTLAQPARNGLLSQVPVTGALADGGTFQGLLNVTQLAVSNGQLLVSGVLTGTATSAAGVVTQINQTFQAVAGSLIGGGAAGVCDILFLDLGPLHLDVLGLTVDLSRVTLDVNAVPGAGNLLGNLLCSVAGLLDNGGPLSGLTQLLNQINALL